MRRQIRETSVRFREAATMYRIRISDHSWLMVALLFLFMLVNFADKAVIGIAAVPMMQELQLSPREFGLIGSSFFLLFPVSAVITGFIVNRVETRWALLVMALVWARFRRSGHHRPCLERRVAGARPRRPADGAGDGRPSGRLPTAFVQPNGDCELVREFRRPVGIVASPVLAGSVSDQRTWFHAGLDRPVGCASAGASVILVISAGWFSQRLLAGGVSSRVARGIFGGACVALGGAALAIMPFISSIPAKVTLTTMGVALPSIIYVIANAVVGEIVPVAQRGALLAIGTAVSISAGILAPYVMGSVVEAAATPLDGFNTGFMICGVVMLVGGIIAMALVRPEHETMRWANEIAEGAIGSA
jgi:MFS family permease